MIILVFFIAVLVPPQEATIASQLLVAVRSRDTSTLRRLCSSTSEHLSAALKRRDGQGHTLMHWAAKSGELEMLELLASKLVAAINSLLCVRRFRHGRSRSARNIRRGGLLFWINEIYETIVNFWPRYSIVTWCHTFFPLFLCTWRSCLEDESNARENRQSLRRSL